MVARGIGFVSHILVVGRAVGGRNWVRFVCLGRGVVNWVRFAFLGAHRSGENPDFEIPGLRRDAAVGLARFVIPPVFGVGASPLKVGVNYWMHACGVRSI